MFSDVVPHRGSEKKSQNDDFLSDLELSWVGFNQTLLSKRKRAFFFCQKFKSGCQPLAHGMNSILSRRQNHQKNQIESRCIPPSVWLAFFGLGDVIGMKCLNGACKKFKSGCQPLAHGMNFFFSKIFVLGGSPEGGAKPQKRNTKDTKSQKRKPTTKNSPQFVKIECLTSGTLCLYIPSTFWTENRSCPYLAVHPGCFFLTKNTPFIRLFTKTENNVE